MISSVAYASNEWSTLVLASNQDIRCIQATHAALEPDVGVFKVFLKPPPLSRKPGT